MKTTNKNRGSLIAFIGIFAILISSAASGNGPQLKQGIWKAILQRPDGKQIVFNFESEYVKGKQVLYVMNAGERMLVDSIRKKGDSIWIEMPFFAAGFAARIKQNGNLEGTYIKRYGNRILEIPFYALYGNKERYPVNEKPAYSVSGRWAVNFERKNRPPLKAVGEFRQSPDGRVTGTFLQVSGDYRYLEGSVSGDSLRLSGFDGSHAVLFAAKIEEGNTLTGEIFSGLTGHENWTATKDPNAMLSDGYHQVGMKPGESALNFKFPSTDGDIISINDARYKNKVVIVQILGSWCPNCMDETAFLSEYYKQHRNKGIEIIGLAYERTTDFAQSKKALGTFQKKFDVQYPFLVTGVAVSDPERAAKTLPQIEAIKAFPTTIFIDKKGVVRKIHSGFNGPATGAHYEEFKKEFNELVNSLLDEKS